MFTQRDQQPKQNKKVVYALLTAGACVAVGTMGYNAMPEAIEDETMNLAGESAIMSKFYEGVGTKCNNWYAASGAVFDSAATDIAHQVIFLNKYKNLLGKYSEADFRSAKNGMIDVVDGLTDAQRDVSSTSKYQLKQLQKMSNKIGNPAWKFQTKYSTTITKKCVHDAARNEKNHADLKAKQAQVQAAYTKMAVSFKAGSTADFKAWDCNKMYPAPVKTTMNLWETITGAGKKGMAIFNQVKAALPEGTMDKIKIPGLPKGITDNIGTAMDYGKQASDMAQGMGIIDGGPAEEMQEMEDFLEELKFLGGDSSATWAERQRIHAEAMGICVKGKAEFAAANAQVSETIATYQKVNIFKAFHKFELANDVATYNQAALATVKDNAQMASSDTGIQKSLNADLIANVKKTLDVTAKRGKKALTLKSRIIA